MYFSDLTPYSYGVPEVDDLLNVGWLGRGKRFKTGTVDSKLIDKLKVLAVRFPFNEMRGFHTCEFCSENSEPVAPSSTMFRGKEIYLGSAEIRVRGSEGACFAAPNLLVHYIERHNYRPPPEFLTALNEHDLEGSVGWPDPIAEAISRMTASQT